MVLEGQLMPGERLNEVVLAERLGISRGPLREAIQRLASEGLLSVVPHKGSYVRTLSAAELRDLYELRIAIETYAVRLAVRRATPPDLEELSKTLEQARLALGVSDDVPYPAGIDVHLQLVSLAGNQALLQAMRETETKVHLARARSARDPDRAREAHREHELIVNYILAGDAEGATHLLEQHLQLSLTNALKRMHNAK